MPALLVILLSLLLLPSRADALELPELAARSGPSVVLLTVFGPTGAKVATSTGFFVSDTGRVVTNHHVIGGASRVEATLADGRKLPIAGLLADDPGRDLAVAQAQGPGPFPALPLGDSKGVRQGDQVVVLGSPTGLSGTLSVGVVSALRDRGVPDTERRDDPAGIGHWGIQITAAMSPGSSGSPVMTPAGAVIAVAVGQVEGGQNLNFAVPSAELRQLLDGLPADPRLIPFGVSAGSPVGRNLLISAAVLGAMGLLAAAGLHLEARRSAAPTGPKGGPSRKSD
jgi:S1-C subfamily serine protease